MLTGSYDGFLVAASFLVAALASFTALMMAARAARAVGNAAAWTWRIGGGSAMGLGIWSMHFIGMLAFSLPIPLGYELLLTLTSLAVAVGSSVFALWLVSLPTLPHARLVGGALLMGSGIASMHYIGMAALNMQPDIDWHHGWVTLSLLIAFAACWCALFIAFRLRSHSGRTVLGLGAACLLGAGICGVHYAGMAAARFPAGSVCGALGADDLPASSLAVLVGAVTVLILGLALGLAWMEQRLETHRLRMRNDDLSNSLDDAQAELTRAALHDPLTHLPNRRLLQKRIEQELLLAGQTARRFALMFVDLDGFKQVNDVYGHHTGDALLVAVSERFRALLGPDDLLARLGGDEFVLVVRVDDVAGITALAQRMQAATGFILVEGHPLDVTASIGIALCPDHASSERQLMACADAAMYQAKAAGRNRHVIYEEGMGGGGGHQLALLAELREAIRLGQWVLHYQPKLDVARQRVSGAEALVRWNHPQRGLVPPDQFIPLAERSGLIGELGRWALDEACRQLQAWHRQGHTDWSMSVNLSALQFNAPRLEHDVTHALARHGLPAHQLLLEITESALMQDTAATAALLKALSTLGVGISIDDFGTGYSSLVYLKRLPATELKIDHAFIRDLPGSREDRLIIASIVALGHAMGMHIVAEGVETPAQRDCLRELGVDYLQGYLLGRPVDAARFEQLHAWPEARIAG
jgi:diguanylate cyclase (GGDEF)-like protein